ncbi:AAA family ATPase [Nocardioides sp. BYT-33-1]|uniref:AAA family ATPase n=1 Tax=Nocardioides sp. BYT-33-1 TaxID=3416952 RepID=UPI003F534516
MSTRELGESIDVVADVRQRVANRVVGRERELDLVLAAVAAGRDLIIEGPPGTSKTTLLRAITAEWHVPFLLVEGNADLTPSKLVGHHNPARVLTEDFHADNFVDGPLLTAMREGGFLYVEEFNRAPDDTLNTLLAAMADREIVVPRVGRVVAKSTFRVIASMNPYDNVGTTRLSSSVHDRMCRLAVDYQDTQAEMEILAVRAPNTHPCVPTELADAVRRDAVTLTRSTRNHPDVRQGSSVRGAIDLALVAGELLALRGLTTAGADLGSTEPLRAAYIETVWDAVIISLSGRIHVDQAVDATPEAVLREIWEDHFVLEAAAASPG